MMMKTFLWGLCIKAMQSPRKAEKFRKQKGCSSLPQFQGLALRVANFAKSKNLLGKILQGEPVTFDINRFDPSKLDENHPAPFKPVLAVILGYDADWGFTVAFFRKNERFSTEFAINPKGRVTAFDEKAVLRFGEMEIPKNDYSFQKPASIKEPEAYAQQAAEEIISKLIRLGVPQLGSKEPDGLGLG